jgi:uncharacterized protein (TIGR02147 family)
MLDIYKYTEFHKYLTDAWREKRSRNAAFSMTAWAHQMGLENSSPLSLAFKGKRALPKKYLPQIIRTLNLDSQQGQYLEALLDLSRAKTPEQKLLYLERLKQISPSADIGGQTVEEFKYLSDPLHGAIIEMTDLKGFTEDAAWIQARLYYNVSIAEVTEAIERLVQLKLLKRGENGKLVKTHVHLTTPQDVADLGTQNYHKSVSEMAAVALFNQEITRREFNSYSFNMDRAKMAKAKKAMRQFINDFLNEFEAKPGEGDETYQLNLQLFQISK